MMISPAGQKTTQHVMPDRVDGKFELVDAGRDGKGKVDNRDGVAHWEIPEGSGRESHQVERWVVLT